MYWYWTSQQCHELGVIVMPVFHIRKFSLTEVKLVSCGPRRPSQASAWPQPTLFTCQVQSPFTLCCWAIPQINYVFYFIRSSQVLEKAMAPHSSTLAWKIPWMEEPGRLQSMGSLGVRHDWATLLSLFTFMHWRRKWQPTPVFLPGEFQGRGAWWAAVSGVAQSQTQLKWLSSSSSQVYENINIY